MSLAAFGIDLGSEATFLVSSQADIVRNELGGHSTGSLVAFSGEERIIGEAAVGQAGANPKNTISQLHTLLGSTYESFESLPLSKHLSFKRKSTEDNEKIALEVNFNNDSEKTFGVEPIVGMLLAKLKRLAKAQLNGQGSENDVCFAFGIPPWYGAKERRALEDAAIIGGFNANSNKILLVESPQALCRVLAKKHPIAEGGASRTHLVVDVGSSHTTMFVCRIYPQGFAPNGQTYEILSSQCDKTCGVATIDDLLFELMRKKAQEKVPNISNLAEPGTKAGARLLRGVERIRKLLGTMPTAEVTVENIAEDTDIRISVSRAELAEICTDFTIKFKQMLTSTIESSGVSETPFNSVEILGGGSRMPLIHDSINDVLKVDGLVFGQKLDSSAIAYGSALLMNAFLNQETVEEKVSTEAAEESETKAEDVKETEEVVPPPVPQVSEFASLNTFEVVKGLDEETLLTYSQEEVKMYEADEVIALIQSHKNEMESFILAMRSAPHQKHGESINVSELEKILDEAENWSYSDEAYSASAETVSTKLSTLKTSVEELCKTYFDAVNSEKLLKEKEMEEEAKKAELEKFENGEEDDDKIDKDNRRLTKTERMKKVMKHKETGTELFKGKNYVHAAKHYKDALTHCTKFFDLSSTDEEEVKAVKITLYLNLATCWTKLENLDQVFKCASDALSLDPNSAKALYRRAFVYEKRKDFEKAKKDLTLANKQPGSEGDNAIATLMKRIELQIKKEKEKEKKMYGKMFS